MSAHTHYTTLMLNAETACFCFGGATWMPAAYPLTSTLSKGISSDVTKTAAVDWFGAAIVWMLDGFDVCGCVGV